MQQVIGLGKYAQFNQNERLKTPNKIIVGYSALPQSQTPDKRLLQAPQQPISQHQLVRPRVQLSEEEEWLEKSAELLHATYE